MASIASSLAQGFESGYGLGLQTDEANEDKRRHKVGEEFQAKQDQRAEAELGLRTRTQDRLEQRKTETLERSRAKDTLDVTGTEIKDLIAAAAGGTPPRTWRTVRPPGEDAAGRYRPVHARQGGPSRPEDAGPGRLLHRHGDGHRAHARGYPVVAARHQRHAGRHRGQEPVADAQGRQRRAGAVAAPRHRRDERVRHDHPQGVGRARPGPDARRLRDPAPARLREHALR